MKIAVLFPGIGYHCDKPLLYYGGRLAEQCQYELRRVSYTDLSRSLDEAIGEALAQTEDSLAQVDWQQYEEILFVSKSIGTAVASAYAKKHEINCRNVYYTPLEQTFDFHPQHGVVFHGTADPWAKTPVIQSKCREHGLPLYIIEGVDHSLEAKGDTKKNLRVLQDVMALTEAYAADHIQYRALEEEELCRALFDQFIRRQSVTDCWRREAGKWVVKADPFIDDWTEEDYQVLVSCLRNTVRTGGLVFAAFCGDALKGFVSVESTLFGGEQRYLDLSSIHVSEDLRGRGIGRILFVAAAAWARKRGAGKLYISSHSAVETQAFYQEMGCVEAREYEPGHVEREPYDCQLEYRL